MFSCIRCIGHRGSFISPSFTFRLSLHYITAPLHGISVTFLSPLFAFAHNAIVLYIGIAAFRYVASLSTVCFVLTQTDTPLQKQKDAPTAIPTSAIPSVRAALLSQVSSCFLAPHTHDALCLFQKNHSA